MDYTDEFPQESGVIYLNHAGVAPWPRRTGEAVARFARENVALGARDYPQWMAREQRLREQLAELINAPAHEDIALLKSTSEGLSFIAAGIDWRSGDEIVTSDEEFPSNRMVWEVLAARGVTLKEARISGAGIDPEAALMQACTRHTRLLAISSVQYGSGLRMDLERLGAFCRQRHILFCVDAIQSLGALPFDVQRLNADFVVADGHKWMLGPEGAALFYVREALREQLRLTEYGWHMTDHPGDYDTRTWAPSPTATRFECGSANMCGIHALSASLSLLLEFGLPAVEARILDLVHGLMERVEAQPGLELFTLKRPGRVAGIVSFDVPGRDNAAVFRRLRERGVVCALRAGRLRFSPHFYNTAAQLERAVALALES